MVAEVGVLDDAPLGSEATLEDLGPPDGGLVAEKSPEEGLLCFEPPVVELGGSGGAFTVEEMAEALAEGGACVESLQSGRQGGINVVAQGVAARGATVQVSFVFGMAVAGAARRRLGSVYPVCTDADREALVDVFEDELLLAVPQLLHRPVVAFPVDEVEGHLIPAVVFGASLEEEGASRRFPKVSGIVAGDGRVIDE